TAAADDAIARLERACRRRDVASCARLGFVTPYRDHAYELRYARVACDLGDGPSCDPVADEYDMPPYTDARHADGARLRRKGCTGGSWFSCWWLARDVEPTDARAA